jgi:broad specificity phosphatase PhoE
MHPIIELALKMTRESSQNFLDRVITTFESIVAKHEGQRILFVLHWGILSVLTQYLQGKDLAVWREIGPWTSCGISEYQQNKNHWHPLYLDRSSHII